MSEGIVISEVASPFVRGLLKSVDEKKPGTIDTKEEIENAIKVLEPKKYIIDSYPQNEATLRRILSVGASNPTLTEVNLGFDEYFHVPGLGGLYQIQIVRAPGRETPNISVALTVNGKMVESYTIGKYGIGEIVKGEKVVREGDRIVGFEPISKPKTAKVLKTIVRFISDPEAMGRQLERKHIPLKTAKAILEKALVAEEADGLMKELNKISG